MKLGLRGFLRGSDACFPEGRIECERVPKFVRSFVLLAKVELGNGSGVEIVRRGAGPDCAFDEFVEELTCSVLITELVIGQR